MKLRKSLSLPAIAGIFTLLFYKQEAGINQCIMAILLTGLVLYRQRQMQVQRGLLLTGLVVCSLVLGIAVAIHGSYWSRFVLLLITWLQCGAVLQPAGNWVPLAWMQAVTAPFTGFGNLMRRMDASMHWSAGKTINRIGAIILPTLLILLFLLFYRQSNPLFQDSVSALMAHFEKLFLSLDIALILVFACGTLLGLMYLYAVNMEWRSEKWSQIPRLVPKKRRLWMVRTGLSQLLKQEHFGAIYLLVGMNILLLLLNIADLKVVWFGFRWQGQLLMSFVHEGTWFLIISILISAATIAWYFRGNLNFYRDGFWLRRLALIWLVQNLWLVASVAMRNARYVDYYGLAYKRIGVYFFLFAIAVVLALLIAKLMYRHGTIFWLNRGLLVVLGTLGLSGVFDWSSLIVKYNLKHYKSAYIHWEFLADMPDRTLPELLRFVPQLPDAKQAQQQLGYRYSDTVEGLDIVQVLQQRREQFLIRAKESTWQEWSLADSRALAELRKQR